MTVLIGSGRTQLVETAAGTFQTITAAALGSAVPVLALFRLVTADSNATAVAHAVYTRAATDGVNDAGISVNSEDAKTTTNGQSAASFGPPGVAGGGNGQVIRAYDPATGNYQSFGVIFFFDSFVNGGVRLEVERAPAAAFYLEYTFFAGVELTVLVDTLDPAGSASTSTDVTDLGVPCDLLFLFGIEGAVPTLNSSRHSIAEGRWSRAQHHAGACVVTAWGDSEDPTEAVQLISDEFAFASIDVDSPGGDLDNRFGISEHASGYTLDRSVDGVSAAWDFVTVQINFGMTKLAKVAIADTPTATGAHAYQDELNIAPDWVESLVTRKTTANDDPANGADASVLGGGSGVPGSGAGVSLVNTHEYGVADSNTSSYSDDRLISIPLGDGTFGTGAVRAALTAKLARGFSIFATQVDAGQAYKMLLTAIGDSQTLTPDTVTITVGASAPMLIVAQQPPTIRIELFARTPEVLGETFQAPETLTLTVVSLTPFTGFILPTPVVISIGTVGDPEVIAPGPPPPELPPLAVSYRDALYDLLPRGLMWPRRLESTLSSLLLGLSEEPAEIERRVAQLLAEVDTRTTTELLDVWEEWLGIADDCGGIEDSLQERRAAVTAKLTSPGGQNAYHFSQLALALGYQISVESFETHEQFRIGVNRVGDPLNGDAFVFCITIHAPLATPRFFRAGASAAGEALVVTGNELLECAFEVAKPAHLLFKYAYDGTYIGYAPWTVIAPATVRIALSNPRPLVT